MSVIYLTRIYAITTIFSCLVPENNSFEGEDENDKVDIDDEIKEIEEEDFEENNDSEFK
jgi:hypothetical protein